MKLRRTRSSRVAAGGVLYTGGLMLQALLFDCDGVIADSETHWNLIDREHLSAFGVPDYDGRFKEHVIGKSFALSIGFYRDAFGIEADPDEMTRHRTGVAARFYGEQIPIYPGVREVLEACRALDLKLALATSSVGALIRPFLVRHDIEKYFDFIVTGEQVQNGKPHPDIYLKAAAGVECAPKNCLVVEDALAGLQAGRAAGARTVAMPDPRWLDPAQFEGQCDFLIDNLGELMPIVEKLRAQK